MAKSSSKTTPLLVPNTSPYRDVHREQWGRRCFLPLNLDLTIQTKHLQSLTVETEKQWNIGNGFVFKVRHTQKHRSLYEDIHGSTVYNSRRLKLMLPMGDSEPFTLRNSTLTIAKNERAL